MMRRITVACVVALVACQPRAEESETLLAEGMAPETMAETVTQFADADIDFDDAPLQPWERQVIAKLVAASDVIHDIFARQVTHDGDAWRARVDAYTGPAAAEVKRLYDIMVGPWNRLEDDAPFLAAGPKPQGAGYYPADLTKEELEQWLSAHPHDRDAFTGYFTIIRREGDQLVAVPYSEAYRADLERAAALLREAADLSQNASLSDYLRKRADAFLSDDYFESDLAWMDVDSRLEPTIGPYEVYEDKLFGFKAAFESFVTVADSAASAELQTLKGHLRDLEARLPIGDEHKNPNRSFESPIRVVDEVYTAGDTRAGVQTTAFNLPNDVRVHEHKGSKKVMLRNVARAKFDKILAPIAKTVLAPDLSTEIEFQPWFTNVVMHELAHGLGPTTVTTPSGERTTVNRALRELHSPLEEAKADVTGLHSLTVLAEQGVYDQTFVRKAYLGHVADMFRAVRFGVGEAHGQANLLQFNWALEKGAITHDEATGLFTTELAKLVEVNRALATEILNIQARGDYEAAASLLQRYGTVGPELQSSLNRLGDVPVDILPRFSVKSKMSGW
jgi:hypothetical protein